ncbi:DMT family transporter [Chitinimonas sp. BJB300]|uniref:DMT family transporter n=1 Tax=Chitinimonas sp. BJB300 TaxID=1559339 RepID=UPI000C1163B3|nr:EamA family transporter [Chitinimonas sp. BJB300]PHV13112.1 EamA family transporter [Chitinimonas sp. BJB300]TSJ84709.1 EamA family transporter [Chitinimonas sp. BJB300]
MPNALLYAIATLIWGSTWLAITFQYGVIPATASVAYRFLLAGLLMLTWCWLRKHRLWLNVAEWLGVVTQGILMFGISYMLVYEAEQHIASGLMAVLNSSMVIFNLIGMRLAFGKAIDAKSLLGAGLGVIGIGLVFWPELSHVNGTNAWFGIGCGLGAAVVASIGNMSAQYNRNIGTPLLPTIGYGMLFGGSLALLFTVLSGQSLEFDTRPSYIASLLYLAVFGSVLAFAAYLTLMGRIGAAKSGYIAVAVPIVALLLSSWFEGFVWHIYTVLGIICAVTGNIIMLVDGSILRRRLGLGSQTS